MAKSPRPSDLPDFRRPPLNEVVLSVQFGALSSFGNGHIGLLWGKFRNEYPELSEQLPIQPAFETFGRAKSAPVPGIQIGALLSPSMSRFWFIDESGNQLVQVQQDRLIHNWRKREDEQQYPRYETVRERFEKELGTLSAFVREERLGELKPNQCEVTYINVIDIPGDTNPHKQLELITPLWGRALSKGSDLEFDNASLQARYIIRKDHQPIGRIHVTFAPVHRVADQRAVIKLEITARAKPEGESLEAALQLLDYERCEVVRTFAAVTTPSMHEAWERIDAH